MEKLPFPSRRRSSVLRAEFWECNGSGGGICVSCTSYRLAAAAAATAAAAIAASSSSSISLSNAHATLTGLQLAETGPAFGSAIYYFKRSSHRDSIGPK